MTVATSVRARRAWIGCATLLAVAGVAKLPTLGQPLLEAHIFRQAQTAYTALVFHTDGIDLLRPQLPVLGAPWVVPFEFPLFQAAASLLMDLGFAPDTAMRTVGLATFLLTGALLFGLLRHVTEGLTATIGLAAFLFSPFGLLWGRTSMIEYLATGGAVGFLWAGVAWADRGSQGTYIAALAGGVVGTLTKIATGGFYLLPLLFYQARRPPRVGDRLLRAALVLIPIAIGLAWTSHADQLKMASEATASLAVGGGPMRAFNFGVLTDRLDVGQWGAIFRTLTFALTGLLLPGWVVLGVVAAWTHPQRRFLVALLVLCFVAPLVVLMPLYVLHDYYLAAVSPAVATLVGLGATWLWRHRRIRLVRAGGLVMGAAWLVSVALTGSYWGRAYGPVVDRERTLEAAAYLTERTRPDEWVVLRGRDWDPSVLYYARRRGFMVRPGSADTQVLAELKREPRYALFVDCPFSGPCRPMELDE